MLLQDLQNAAVEELGPIHRRCQTQFECHGTLTIRVLCASR